MICEMSLTGAKPDPRKVGGLNQGGGPAAGFQVSWSSWQDIKQMNGMCAGHIGCRYNIPRDHMASPLIIGSRGTNVTGECEPCLQFFGKKVNAMKKPAVSKLASDILKSSNGGDDALSGDIGATLAPNPEGDDQETLIQTNEGASTSRRRRRQQGYKASKGNKKTSKKKNSRKLRRIGELLQRADFLQEHQDLSFKSLDDVVRLSDDNCNKTL